jgi:hypothetical protein
MNPRFGDVNEATDDMDYNDQISREQRNIEESQSQRMMNMIRRRTKRHGPDEALPEEE